MCSDRPPAPAARRAASRAALPALLVLALLVSAACGKKGDPQPPLRFVPQTTEDLAASQRGFEVLLELPYPTTTTAGMALPGLERVEVWRAARPVPARLRVRPEEDTEETGDVESMETSREEAEVRARAEARERRQELNQPLPEPEFQAGAETVAVFAGDSLASAVVGDRIVLRLGLPRPLPDPPEIHYYAVRTVAEGGDASALSPQAVLPTRTPPEPPRDFQVEAEVDGVEISWRAAEEPEVVGYNLYRRDARSRVFTTPVARPPKGSDRFFDRTVTVGETYIYTVTAVASRQPLVESALVEVREVDYRDRFPPPTPASLVALAEEGRVRVVWEGVEADDLAGYLVSRRRGAGDEGDFRLLTPEPRTGTEYVDGAVERGVVYTYRVIARDLVGNESDPAEATTEAR